jgi:transcriptional regulator with XRE-family HTH domain
MVKRHIQHFETGIIFLGTMPKRRLKLPPVEYATSESFGERLARIRKERSLTQTALAEKIGIIQSLITDYERDRLRMHPEMVVRFAQALEISTDELLGAKASRTLGGGKLSLKVARRLSKIESLPDRQQRALLQTIDAYLKGSGV